MAAGSVEFQERACLACLWSHFGRAKWGAVPPCGEPAGDFVLSMPSHPESWLRVTPQGLFCEPGGFFIDPARPVDRAVITHGHADHARPGHGAVLATPETLAIMRARYGEAGAGAVQQPLRYGEVLQRTASPSGWSPAGHVLGSAQVVVRLAGAAASWSPATTSAAATRPAPPFEPVPCDVFVTEATFGLPVFRHPPTEARDREAAALGLAQFPERSHLVGAYALGKAQRLIRLLREAGWDGADLPARRAGGALRPLRALGVDLGAAARRRRSAEQGGASPARSCSAPPSAVAATAGPAACPTRSSLRLGLDAGAAARQPARRRAAAGDLRPCRLGRADRHDRRARRARGLGHPRPRGGAGACRGAARHPRPGAAPGRLRGGGRRARAGGGAGGQGA